MIDAFGRNINYLRISITDLCNLRCRYCMPEGGVEKTSHEDILTLEEIYEIAKVFTTLGVNKIRITGGEPLVRKGALTLVEKLGGLKEVTDLAMTTNGILLKDQARDLKMAGLNRVNISLDTLKSKKYSYITRGGNIKDVLDSIDEVERVGLGPTKINTVLIKSFNDDEIDDFINLTREYDIDVRFIELMPIGEASTWALDRYISNQVIKDTNKELVEVENEDLSSPAVYYRLPGAKGRVGIINPISCKFCSNCNRIRLTSKGGLKLCLHSEEEIDLKGPLRRGEKLEDVILEALSRKPEAHHLEEGKYIHSNMVQIGG